MRTLELHIVTPEKTIKIPGVRSLVCECPDGKRGILPGHISSLAELVPGVLKYTDEGGEEHYLALSGGVIEITPQVVTILTEAAEEASEIDVARAQEALERAQKRLKEKLPEADFARAQAALLRSLARLRATEAIQKTKNSHPGTSSSS
ncbi:MAG TPA: ATP synthase F1 subunit epsilon [Candidatus Atribacteria bacterium]|nr:ATP synthase F1 subunit epsilon [Candidatus Atribacteria bacterium]